MSKAGESAVAAKSAAAWPRQAMRRVMALLLLVTVAACSPIYTYHGFIPDQQDLDELMIGVDTRSTVETIIGKPGTSGLLAEGAWYYVRSEFRRQGASAPTEVNREVVAISFDDQGRVRNIERFGLERGQVVVLERRVTDSNIDGIPFLRQLFGNTSAVAGLTRSFSQ